MASLMSRSAIARPAVASFRPSPVAPRLPAGIRQRAGVKTQAYVEASVTYAVTQQAIAFAAVLGLDAVLFEKESINAPDLKVAGAGAGATLASVAILNTGISALSGVGLVIGLLASGAMFYYHGKRTADAKEDPSADWPGSRAPPATMALISFFALNVFIQGIRAEL